MNNGGRSKCKYYKACGNIETVEGAQALKRLKRENEVLINVSVRTYL